MFDYDSVCLTDRIQDVCLIVVDASESFVSEVSFQGIAEQMACCVGKPTTALLKKRQWRSELFTDIRVQWQWGLLSDQWVATSILEEALRLDPQGRVNATELEAVAGQVIVSTESRHLRVLCHLCCVVSQRFALIIYLAYAY